MLPTSPPTTKQHDQKCPVQIVPPSPPTMAANISLAGVVVLVFEIMPGARVKDWTTIKGRMEPEGTKKNKRHINMKGGWWRRGGTHLRVAGMQCNIRKTYTQPPSNPVLMKN